MERRFDVVVTCRDRECFIVLNDISVVSVQKRGALEAGRFRDCDAPVYVDVWMVVMMLDE